MKGYARLIHSYKKNENQLKKCVRCGVLIKRTSRYCRPCSADIMVERTKAYTRKQRKV